MCLVGNRHGVNVRKDFKILSFLQRQGGSFDERDSLIVRYLNFDLIYPGLLELTVNTNETAQV